MSLKQLTGSLATPPSVCTSNRVGAKLPRLQHCATRTTFHEKTKTNGNLPSRAGSEEEQEPESDPLVQVAVLNGDGHHDAGHEHDVGLLQVLLADRVRGHDA